MSFALPNLPDFSRSDKSLASSRHRTHPGRRTANTTVGPFNTSFDMITGPVARPFDTFFRDIFEISDNVTPNEDEIIMMRRMINKFAICLSFRKVLNNLCKKFNFDK